MKNRNKVNQVFSAFLVIGYVICAYFFSTLAAQVSGVGGTLIQILLLVIFGLLLFYATRVGEGRQVKRFSLAVLLLIDIPALFIILAGIITGFPFHSAIAAAQGVTAPSIIMTLACIALGYGIPYTFFSGYEIAEDEEEAEAVAEEAQEDKKEFVAGGIAEELNEVTEDEAAEEVVEEAKEAVEAAEAEE